MLGWIIAALAAAAVVTIVVEYLDRKRAEKEIREHFGKTLGAFVKKVKNGEMGKSVTFKDLSGGKEMVIEAPVVDDSIREGSYIFV